MIERDHQGVMASTEAPKGSQEHVLIENRLRPVTLSDFIGQEELKKNLQITISAAKQREEVLDHTLFHGPPGLGKTTLANVIAKEMNGNLKITSGPAIEKQGDLAAIISNLQDGDVLFIDEIHRLRSAIEEVLYSAMEDFAIDMILGKGPSARSMRLSLPRFTLIGATTKLSLLSSPLRDRFGNIYRLTPYPDCELAKIVTRSAGIVGCDIDGQAAQKLATAARKTPRIANRLLKRIRDYNEVMNPGKKMIDPQVVEAGLNYLGVSKKGLEASDLLILQTIMDKFGGGPVGLSTLAAAVAEDVATLEEVCEPFLMQLGLLERSPRGRKLTLAGYDYLGVQPQLDCKK